MSFLGRDAILGADDFEYEVVNIPSWGGKVRVRPLNAKQRSQIEGQMAHIAQAKKGYEKLGDAALRMVVWCVVDEQGQPIFTEQDVSALAKKSSKPILHLRDVITRISGMEKESVDEAEEDFTDSQDSLSSID